MRPSEDPPCSVGKAGVSTARVVLQEHYEILSKIGEGGFGQVYKARQLATGQLVALKKRLAPTGEVEPQADLRAARFLREARICALLHHPNIVQLIDAGTAEDGQLFTVFAFAPGENLAEVLATEGPLAPQESRHLMLQVLDALVCAHAQGVVHRDLKPSNIMVVRTGARRNAVVLDFGIGALTANVLVSPTRLTGTGDLLGTLGYAAPEQWRGSEVAASADLFSWGLVFIECLTGCPVYACSSQAEVIYRLLGPEPVLIPAALAAHPLGSLLRRATCKDTAEREASARDLFHALEACDLTRLERATLKRAPSDLGVHPLTEQATSPLLDDHLPPATSATSTKHRRYVTAMCCRVSVRLGKTIASDVEDADELTRASLARCAEVARKQAGHVMAALGDQLLVYFGFPRADEDAAKRAGRAALAMTGFVHAENERQSPHGAFVDLRIGIHTGLLVAADPDRGQVEHAAVGETPRVASGLASSATPGAVLVTAEMERLLRADFDLRAIGSQSAVGIEREMPVFALERQKARPPGATGKRTRLIGRNHELGMLYERWRRAVAGTGQCSLITGEPGIGKSRLTQELRLRIADKEHVCLEGRCVPDAQNDVLLPLIPVIEEALEVDREESPARIVARLETALAALGLDLAETVPLMLDLFSLPVRPPYFVADVSPQRHMERLQGAMLSVLFALAEDRPLLFVVEDLHWASPTILGFLTRLMREAPSYPICVVTTARPEFSSTFSTAGVLHLPLARLDADETRALAVELAGDKALPTGHLDAVVNRTDGIPLFVEEMTRLVVETGVAFEAGAGVEVSGRLPDAVMPGPLRALISARLDRLDRAKITAAVAAALGRDFNVEMLSAISPFGPEAVERDLERLAAAGLVMRRGHRKESMMTFKHTMVREAAYDSLPRAERRNVHRRIAEVLEERFAEIAQARPELMAHHFAAADRAGEAIPYAQRAAERAVRQCAYSEAVAIASKVLDWVPALPPGDAVQARLAANGIMIQALMPSRGWADAEIKRIVEESSALLLQLPSSAPNKFSLLWSLFAYYHTVSDRPAARRVAEEAATVAHELGDAGLRAVAAAMVGSAYHAEGNLSEAGRSLEAAIALYTAQEHREHGFQFGLDTLVWAKALLAHIRWFEGQDARALQLVEESVAWARELAHIPSIALALLYGSQVHQHRNDKGAVVAMTEELLTLAGKYGLPAYEGYASIVHAWAKGDEQPIAQIIGVLEVMGCNIGLSYFSSLSADILADRGAFDAAIAVVDRCLALCEQNDEHHYEHSLHWRRALYLQRKGSADQEARASLERAAAVARRCGAWRVENLALGHDQSVNQQ